MYTTIYNKYLWNNLLLSINNSIYMSILHHFNLVECQ